MRYFMLMAAMLLLATGALFAQGYYPGGANVSTIMLKTDNGLFALRSGVLVKYDVTTLKQVNVLPIFGPAPPRPEFPTDRTDQAAMQAFNTDRQAYMAALTKRQAPAIMIATKDSLLVVIGESFGKISQATLQLETKPTTLTDPAAVADPAAPPRMPMATEPIPGYVLDGTTLYLMRAKEVLAINIADGSIITRKALPEELQPAQMNYPGGGNRGGGGGGGFRGNRGGGGGAPGGGGPVPPAAN